MVAITNHYGIVVKLSAFSRHGISVDEFVQKTEATLIGQDEGVVSFGPCFGEEAGNKITARMEDLGFEYVSDYFVFNFDMPEWVALSAASRPGESV